MTKIQETIFNIIAQSNRHLTADEIFTMVRQKHPTASLSTVYRNLNSFADAGEIRRIRRATGADYYERNLAPHDHAYCVKCGMVSDFAVPGLKDYLAKNFEYQIYSFELFVNFMCPACAGEKSETNPGREEGEYK